MFGLHSLGQPTISMGDVKNWAAGVRDQHLSDGTDPTELLVKISQQQNLTPHQVGVLAGEINKVIHTAKYASAEDKYHAANFPLADASKALAALQIPHESEKFAFEIPDPKFTQEIDYDAAFGVSKEASEEAIQEKTAAQESSFFRHDLKTAQMKLARAKQEQDRVAFMTKVSRDEAENDFIKKAHDEVLRGYGQEGRIQNLGTIAHAANCAGLGEVASRPLAKLALALGESGYLDQDKADEISHYLMSTMEKKADVIAPEHMISEFMNAKVVNGNHPLLISLKTFKDYDERAMDEANRKRMIDDRHLIFSQKVRAL